MQSILQTKPWAEFKSRHGWQSHWFELAEAKTPLSVLSRPLPFGLTLAYAPEVSLAEYSDSQLLELAAAIRQRIPKAIFFRLELFERLGDTTASLTASLTTAGYRKAFEEVQPEHRQWLDITPSETAILAAMKEKGRYNIRLAERKGVSVRRSTDIKNVEVFYGLFRQTAVRDGFTIRSQSYFQDLCQMLFINELGELIIAEAAGQPLVALIITYYDGLASYLYGASSDQQRNLMAPYAAHMEAIRAAKEKNCKIYDLLQIASPTSAPASTPLADGDKEVTAAEASDRGSTASPIHKYANLTRFKQQFGGEAVALVGSWDAIYRPNWYRLFRLGERWRRGL